LTATRGRADRRARRGRPPRHERDARLAARREALLDAAAAAITADGPGVTMTRMAAEAGVTKPVLYRYFGDRAGLYEAIASRYAAGLLAELRDALGRDDSPRRLLEAGVDAYLAYVERQPELYRFLTQRLPGEEPRGQRLVTGFTHRVAAEVAALLHENLRAVGVDSRGAELLGFGITGMVQVAADLWLDRQAMPRARAVQYLAGALWWGLVGIDRVQPAAASRAVGVPPLDGATGTGGEETSG
jgi:AcrR family transcriptional regulator